jgi:hypothetical protein
VSGPPQSAEQLRTFLVQIAYRGSGRSMSTVGVDASYRVLRIAPFRLLVKCPTNELRLGAQSHRWRKQHPRSMISTLQGKACHEGLLRLWVKARTPEVCYGLVESEA